MEDDYGEVDRGEEFGEPNENESEGFVEDEPKPNDLTSMFADIEMKLKAIAETLQGQIEEMRQMIEALEKK